MTRVGLLPVRVGSVPNPEESSHDGSDPTQCRGYDPVPVRRVRASADREAETQPGFLYHVAFVDEGGGFTVSEIWESEEQHDKWFSENVEGVIPGIEQQVIKVHAVHTP